MQEKLTPPDHGGDLKPRIGKAPLALLPRAGLLVMSAAMEEGATKYAPNNWKDCPKDEAGTYIHAMLRHAHAFADGEKYDPDSKVSHLGHIMACAGILCYLLNLSYEESAAAQRMPEKKARINSMQSLFGKRPDDLPTSPSQLKADE